MQMKEALNLQSRESRQGQDKDIAKRSESEDVALEEDPGVVLVDENNGAPVESSQEKAERRGGVNGALDLSSL